MRLKIKNKDISALGHGDLYYGHLYTDFHYAQHLAKGTCKSGAS